MSHVVSLPDDVFHKASELAASRKPRIQLQDLAAARGPFSDGSSTFSVHCLCHAFCCPALAVVEAFQNQSVPSAT